VATIHIRFQDGPVTYYNVEFVRIGERNGVLSFNTDEGDHHFFSPGYWQEYVVDPQADDPFRLSGK
jgi:hypothetical protein